MLDGGLVYVQREERHPYVHRGRAPLRVVLSERFASGSGADGVVQDDKRLFGYSKDESDRQLQLIHTLDPKKRRRQNHVVSESLSRLVVRPVR